MSGDRFLVRFVEINHSERILAHRSMLKEDVNLCVEDLSPIVENAQMSVVSAFMEEDNSYLEGCHHEERW